MFIIAECAKRCKSSLSLIEQESPFGSEELFAHKRYGFNAKNTSLLREYVNPHYKLAAIVCSIVLKLHLVCLILYFQLSNISASLNSQLLSSSPGLMMLDISYANRLNSIPSNIFNNSFE